MRTANEILALPRTLEEFQNWEPEDGFKYEWNDGEIIQFKGMDKKQFYIFANLNNFFIKKGFWKKGTLVSEYDTKLSGIQMRRPDIAYFTQQQVENTAVGEDEIPEFVIEIISKSDNPYKIEEKITEYFKAGVKVVWSVFPDPKLVYIYTSRKQVQVCMDDDICSAKPVLPAFEISVNDIFALKTTPPSHA
ncbi:Uma2 family endonuclease [Emticicia sp. SJ17W-69]|uniref:Uma2 family endonuclease n=1 Tax=Emticicia sp. SJ17W-69 TaxID=3421657 RepID=UPI003EBBC475